MENEVIDMFKPVEESGKDKSNLLLYLAVKYEREREKRDGVPIVVLELRTCLVFSMFFWLIMKLD